MYRLIIQCISRCHIGETQVHGLFSDGYTRVHNENIYSLTISTCREYQSIFLRTIYLSLYD